MSYSPSRAPLPCLPMPLKASQALSAAKDLGGGPLLPGSRPQILRCAQDRQMKRRGSCRLRPVTTRETAEDRPAFEGLLLAGPPWSPPPTAPTAPVPEPATGEVLATVAQAGAEDVDRAVPGGAAPPTWRAARGRRNRAAASAVRLLQRIADADHGSRASASPAPESRNAGKPIAAARGEVARPPTLRVLRRRGQQVRRADDARRARRPRLHAPRAARRRAP